MSGLQNAFENFSPKSVTIPTGGLTSTSITLDDGNGDVIVFAGQNFTLTTASLSALESDKPNSVSAALTDAMSAINGKGNATFSSLTISNGGTVAAGAAATFSLKAGTGVSSAASETIAASSSVEVFGSASGLTFNLGAGDTLKLDAPTNFKGTVAAFTEGDALDLAGVAYNASGGNATSATYKQTSAATGASPAVGTLTVKSGSQSATIQLLGNYIASSFIAGGDGSGGAIISEKGPAAAVVLASSKG
jgi:hypothetical protein